MDDEEEAQILLGDLKRMFGWSLTGLTNALQFGKVLSYVHGNEKQVTI